MTGNTHTWKILSSNPTDGLGQDGLWDPYYEAPITFRLDMQIVFRWQFHIPYFFSVSLKFWACYITVQWGDLTEKNVT